MTLLQDIVAQKQIEVAALRGPRHDFVAALRKRPCSIIAEYKRASPSGGELNTVRTIEQVAQLYESGGAAAISILTDERFFQGELDFIQRARAVCDLPILRKDFIIDPLQVYQSKFAGADAILLIVRILSDAQLQTLSALAHELQLQILVEVHSAAELERARLCEPDMIGVNTRDLDSLAIRLELLEELRPRISPTICAVAESGITTLADFTAACTLGYQAVLMGTVFMKSDNPLQVLKEFSAYGQ